MFPAVFFLKICVGADDDEVTFLREAGGGAVDADDAGVFLAADGVGRETLAVIDVQDIDLLVGQDVGLVHDGTVDGDRALIMKVGLGHHGAVNLAFEHTDIHIA